ncbi:MAG TPA: ketoacyl-ACP synthase III, partial [Myxococcaceae bacterium]|nr:ketoacyl-ACP synthase III [Myxococcaceae bacterium]
MSFFQPAHPVYLVGPTSYLPERVMTNQAVLEWMGVEVRPSWLSHRTGIQERRWVEESQACSDLALAAARRLFEQHGLERQRITQLVLATVSGDFPSPPTSPLLLPGLGLEAIGVLDL